MNAREFEDPSFICCCPEACTHTNSAHIDAACGKAEQLVRREHTLENDAIERKTLTDEHERNKKKTAAKCAREKKCCGQKWRPIYRLPSRIYLTKDYSLLRHSPAISNVLLLYIKHVM